MGPIGPIVQGVSSRRKDSRGQRINIKAINFCVISNIVSAFFLSFKKMNDCIFFCHCNPSDNQLLKMTINKDGNSLIAHYNYSSANDYRCLCQSGTRTKLQQQWPSKCQQLGTYLSTQQVSTHLPCGHQLVFGHNKKCVSVLQCWPGQYNIFSDN